MKVGDLVKWKDSDDAAHIFAVSDDEAFVNTHPSEPDSGWWPSKCFDVVKSAEPEYVEVVVNGPIDNQRFHLVLGEKLVISLDVTRVETT